MNQKNPARREMPCTMPPMLTAGGTDTLFGADVTPRTTDEWYTPPWIFKAARVTFDMDVCAPADPLHRTVPARQHLTAADDGLTHPWHGLVWMNPPYSQAAAWVDRWTQHPSGLALLMALPEVRWRGAMCRAADAVTIIAPHFIRPDNTKARLPVACLLVSRGDVATEALARVAQADRYGAGAYHVRPQVLP